MLAILEVANNHGGSVEVGKQIIREHAEVTQKFPQFEYAFKFQYRDIDGGSYIHPSADPEHKYVKRFKETNLSWDDRISLKDYAKELGFKIACTPFDEESVGLVARHGYDILKIGSPSFTDKGILHEARDIWVGPVIASCGGATGEQIDYVVNLFAGYDFTLMHCVSLYPMSCYEANVARVGWLKRKYPGIKVGYSTHERYDSTRLPAALALALGAEVFEKHVCIDPRPNDYSVTPKEMAHWLYRMRDATLILGQENYVHREVELQQLAKFSRQKIDGRMYWKP